MASHVSQWYLPTSSAGTIAVTPDITPVERSNSPPIISSPTGTAMIPKNAACCVHAASPVWLSHRWLELLSVIANRIQTAIAAISAPSSGRRIARVMRLIGTSRSSPAAGSDGGGAGAGVGCEVALMVSRSLSGYSCEPRRAGPVPRPARLRGLPCRDV